MQHYNVLCMCGLANGHDCAESVNGMFHVISDDDAFISKANACLQLASQFICDKINRKKTDFIWTLVIRRKLNSIVLWYKEKTLTHSNTNTAGSHFKETWKNSVTYCWLNEDNWTKWTKNGEFNLKTTKKRFTQMHTSRLIDVTVGLWLNCYCTWSGNSSEINWFS